MYIVSQQKSFIRNTFYKNFIFFNIKYTFKTILIIPSQNIILSKLVL